MDSYLMDLILTRSKFNQYGIFGCLDDIGGHEIAVTLEHAYESGALNGETTYLPKIPIGKYLCVRGTHTLDGRPVPFETFEITGVEDHTGILFHKGNVNADSSGCVLLGNEMLDQSIIQSKLAFDRFMDCQSGVDKFYLTVKNE